MSGGYARCGADTPLVNARSVGRDHRLEIQAGDLLAARYRVEAELGRGGMGVVLAVRHIALGTRMALKVMRPDLGAEPDALRRFLREARAAASLESDHVVRVFDVGTLDGGEPYLAMEHLEGEDLGRLLAERGRTSVEEAVEFLLQAIDAVAEAHSLGIIHRDLKPSNLFVVDRRDGTTALKVLDFGAAKLVGPLASEDLSGSTRSQLVGTPQYMSPEQLRATPDLDARTDVWSLGVILFRLVSGRLPFDAGSFPELCASIIGGSPPELPDASPELTQVFRRCLAKDREARYASVHELADALRTMAPERLRTARRLAPLRRREVPRACAARTVDTEDMPETLLQRFDADVSSLPGTAAENAEPPAPARRRKAVLVSLVAAGVSAMVVLVFWLRAPARMPPPAPASAGLGAVQAKGPPVVAPLVDALPLAAELPMELSRSEARPRADARARPAPRPRPRSVTLQAVPPNTPAAVPAASVPRFHSEMGGRL